MKIGFIGRNDLDGVEQDARFAAQHGFEGLEYNFWADFADLTAGRVEKMRSILDAHGVYACSLGLWGWNHLSPDAAEREASLGHLERAIEFTDTLGAKVLIIGAGEIPGATAEENAEEFGRVLPPYVEKAREAGLEVALYMVHGKSFLQGLEDYRLIWEHAPEVGIKLDPANVRHAGSDYLQLLREAGDRVGHVHIKEHIYMDGELVAQPAAGMGDIEWGKVMAFLYEHGYDGHLVIEPHGPIWSQSPLRRTCCLLSRRHIQQFIV